MSVSKHYLINKANLRVLLLQVAEKHRAHKYAHVSASVYDEAQAVLRNWAIRKVNDQPSAGKTIK